MYRVRALPPFPPPPAISIPVDRLNTRNVRLLARIHTRNTHTPAVPLVRPSSLLASNLAPTGPHNQALSLSDFPSGKRTMSSTVVNADPSAPQKEPAEQKPSQSAGAGPTPGAQDLPPVTFPVSPVPKNPLGEGRYIKTAAALMIG